MGLADDLAAEPRRKSGPPCMTCTWLARLTEQDRQAFKQFVAEPGYNRALLHRVIAERYDYPACESTLKYHLQYHEPC